MSTMAKRKPVRLDHHHFGESPDDPTFNIDAARQSHADVMRRWDDPVEGDDFKALMLHTIQNATAVQIEKHRADIQAFLDAFGATQKETVGKAIVKAYVANSVSAAREFGIKDAGQQFGKDSAWDESKWTRNHGQFSSYRGGRVGQKLSDRRFEPAATGADLGYGSQGRSYDEHLRQQALLAQAARIGAAAGSREQEVLYRIKDKKGNVRDVVPGKGQVPKLKRGERLLGPRGTGIKGDDLTMNDVGFNLIQALGVPAEKARRSVDAAGRTVGAGSDFATEWNNHANANYGTEKGAAYHNIKAGADALQAIAGGNPKAQVAITVGKWVGTHGPEAEKVLGPHARKTAYKYRGVERAARDLPIRQGGMTDRDYHDRLVAKIAGNIPSAGVHALNLASGHTAPSHGYLINDKGKVITEAHGYGDDHYLPFKLSVLNRMRGGSYIRTRSTGGPTTEDIYATAISGGTGFTVASRQGTYEVAFDSDFTHHKRFGDIALGMSKRYGKILDAVSSGKVVAKGEVTDKQYQDWVVKGMEQFEHDPNQFQLAHDYAKGLAEQQESKHGRPLSLDGEGYEYALKALHSQYPYYIASTAYTRPNDQRFWDISGEDGHIARIGSSHERDTGYVKARHIKSADALVGYYDPSIAGESKGPTGQPTGSGKVSGDLAHYANWRHNPYNADSPAARKAQGEADRRSREQAEAQARHAAENRAQHGATGGVGSNTVQQGSQLRNTGQGAGRVSLATGLDARGQRLMDMVKAVHTYRTQHGQGVGAEIVQWHANPDAFAQDYAANPNKVEAQVMERYNRLPGNPTSISLRQHPDEEVDTRMNQADDEWAMNELRSHLQTPESQDIREALAETGGVMYHEDPDTHVDADPAARWDAYHFVLPRQDLLNRAFEDVEDPGEKAGLIHRANEMMDKELELDQIEQNNEVPYEDKWNPEDADYEAEGEPKEAHIPGISHEQARALQVSAVGSALTQVADAHRLEKPTGAGIEDLDDRLRWEKQRAALNNHIAAWEENPMDEDDYRDAVFGLGTLLKDPTTADLGGYEVDLPGGRATLSQLHRGLALTAEQKRHGLGKRYTVVKRTPRYRSTGWSARPAVLKVRVKRTGVKERTR
jgi:hypothetical protein